MKDFEKAISPAISAGLGAIALRNKMRSLSEGSTILNFGNSGSYAGYNQKPMESGSGKTDKGANASTSNMFGNNDGFAKKTKTNIFQPSKKTPVNASTLIGIPKMPPSNS